MARHDVRACGPRGAGIRAEQQTAQAQEVFGADFAPEHARLFEAAAHHALAAGFDDPAADEVALGAKLTVTGPPFLIFKVGDSRIALQGGPELFFQPLRAAAQPLLARQPLAR